MFLGRRLMSSSIGLALAMSGGAAVAAEHVVNAKLTSWDPMVVYVQPGDTVKWENMSGHNTESIAGLMPEGGDTWQSTLGEAYSHSFKTPGAYIYKCAPHFSSGMVGVVVVGDGKPANLDALKDSPENKGMIGRTYRKLVKELEGKGWN